MAYNRTKCDPALGQAVHEHLQKLGIETPTIGDSLAVDSKTKIDQIESHIREVWKILGMDLTDDSLVDTPNRIAKMMVLDHHWGLLPENFPKMTVIDNKMQCDEMVTITGIPVMSNCEHHGVTFAGTATVAYIPKNKVVGLSKISRVVEYFSRRPQVQERLTSQIQETLAFVLETENVAVSVTAQHYCMISRGVESPNSWTHTTKLGGSFRHNEHTKKEFLMLVNRGN